MKKILSIDGGGIRGLIPALVLTEIEKRTNQPISKCFDLIGGTSTGGILALGLVKDNGSGAPKYTAAQLAGIYQQRGQEIFHRSLWKGVSSGYSFLDEKYSHEGLERVLLEYFEDDALECALNKVFVTTYDIHNRTPVFLKSWSDKYNNILMREAARATSAAPTYFEPKKIHVHNAVRTLIDGGVFVNSPAVSAYAEAIRLFPDEKEFFVLSLGTGELIREIAYEDAKDWGKAGWLLPLLSCVFDGVADASDYQLEQFLGKNYHRLQIDLDSASDDMDNATKGNIENLVNHAKRLIRTHKLEINEIVSILLNKTEQGEVID